MERYDLPSDPVASSEQAGMLRIASEADEKNCGCQDAAVTPSNLHNVLGGRKANTAYKSNEILACPYQPGLLLKCVQAGTTSTSLLNTTNVTKGQVITDGGVKWLVYNPLDNYLPLSGGTMTGSVELASVPKVLRANTDMEGGEIQFQHSKTDNTVGIDLFDENGTIQLRLIDYGVVDRNIHIPFNFNFNTSDIGTSKGVVAQVESMQLGLNGWIKLTHGFQVCWGEIVTASGLITFPRAFKDRYSYQIICIDRGSSRYNLGAIQSSGTAFQVYTPYECGVTYIAVGQGV